MERMQQNVAVNWFERAVDNLNTFARHDGLTIATILAASAGAIPLLRFVLRLVERHMERVALVSGAPDAPRRFRVIFDILNYLGVSIIVAVGSATALSALGVNTGALLASAGVVGFGVGFGAQTLVKDLINGFFLLAEGQYTIGDLIEVNGVEGVVEKVTLRTTSLRADNGDVHIVASGDIRIVTNKSKPPRR